MSERINYWRNARTLRVYALLYIALISMSLVLVHAASYEPAVSYLLLYMVGAVGITAAVVVMLLPAELFTDGFSGGAYAIFALVGALAVFFSGGASSELYLLFFTILLAAAFHGSWTVGLAALASVLVGYLLAVMPDLLAEGEAAPVFFRLVILGLVGGFVLVAARGSAGGAFSEQYATDEDGSMLLELVSGEISAGRGEQLAVILVDPGRRMGDVELLLERVRARIAEPILLGEGAVFGMVLSGAEERAVESAAGRALAVAGSLGSRGPRAGAAIYPRDARSPEELLAAAGRALETAFESERPNIVLAGGGGEDRYKAAR
jgi:GGDEF domain-containing protein